MQVLATAADVERLPRIEWMTIQDIADELLVSRETATAIMRQMPYVRIGRLYRVRREMFDKWVKRQEERSRR